jgi:hypothetical protein
MSMFQTLEDSQFSCVPIQSYCMWPTWSGAAPGYLATVCRILPLFATVLTSPSLRIRMVMYPTSRFDSSSNTPPEILAKIFQVLVCADPSSSMSSTMSVSQVCHYWQHVSLGDHWLWNIAMNSSWHIKLARLALRPTAHIPLHIHISINFPSSVKGNKYTNQGTKNILLALCNLTWLWVPNCMYVAWRSSTGLSPSWIMRLIDHSVILQHLRQRRSWGPWALILHHCWRWDCQPVCTMGPL